MGTKTPNIDYQIFQRYACCRKKIPIHGDKGQVRKVSEASEVSEGMRVIGYFTWHV